MQLVDSHCHLDMLQLDKTSSGSTADLATVLQQARHAGVVHFLSININPWKIDELRQLVAPFPDVSLTLGLHPMQKPQQDLSTDALINLAQAEDIVALGETGLDYHYGSDSKSLQQEYFQRHLDAALAVNKPVIVHTREAGADTLAQLHSFCAAGGQGVIHCFTEDLAFARAAIGMGLYVSFSGIVTFKSATSIQAVARVLPLDRMLVETDSPYLAPVPYRGKQNEPAFVRKTAEFIAQLRGLDPQLLAQQTTENFFRLFPLVMAKVAKDRSITHLN